MVDENTLRYISGILLIISAITHNVQLFVYGFAWHQITAALYGVSYGVLGILLLKFTDNKIILIMCIIIPAIGGTLGILRFITILSEENVVNYFIIFHVIVDIIVIPSCIYLYLKLQEKKD